MDFKLYNGQFRQYVRQVSVGLLPGPVNAEKKIAVVGLPRSGTSWLAKVISLAAGVHYYFEPDQVYDRTVMVPYYSEHQTCPNLEKHIHDSFKGRVHNEYAIAEQDYKAICLAYSAQTVLLKWVRFSLCLNWIAAHFPNIHLVQIIRHPVPLFLSWEQRGWGKNALNGLLMQEDLMQGPLLPYKNILNDAETFWEKAGAFWGAVTFMQLNAHRDGWMMKEHEWFCESSEAHFRVLFAHLGLAWNADVEAFLLPNQQRKSGPGYGDSRDSAKEIDKWHGRISDQELEQLFSTIKQFDLKFAEDMTFAKRWF